MRTRGYWASTTRWSGSRALTESMRRCASEAQWRPTGNGIGHRASGIGHRLWMSTATAGRARRSGLLGQHAHVQALLGALLLELHLAGHLGEQRMVAADTDVRAGTDRRAALTHEDVPGEHLLASEALDPQAGGVRGAAVLGTAASLFVCHDLRCPAKQRSAGADVRDLHFREQLSVVLLPQVMRAALELDHRHLGALAVAHNRGEYLAPLEGRLAELDVRALADQQHFAELDRGARLGVELLDAQHVVLGHPILLAARGDDRVHGI